MVSALGRARQAWTGEMITVYDREGGWRAVTWLVQGNVGHRGGKPTSLCNWYRTLETKAVSNTRRDLETMGSNGMILLSNFLVCYWQFCNASPTFYSLYNKGFGSQYP